MASDLRALLNPILAAIAARPKYQQMPQTTWTPPPTPDNPNPAPMVTPARTVVYTDPADLPAPVVVDGHVDLAAQLSLLQAAFAQFTDLQIRTVTGSTTLTQQLLWVAGVNYDIPVTWTSTPLAAVKGAVCRIDGSIIASGKVQAVVLDSSVTNTGCTVRCTTVAPVTINIGVPITVTATALYLYWQPYGGTT